MFLIIDLHLPKHPSLLRGQCTALQQLNALVGNASVYFETYHSLGTRLNVTALA